MSGHTISAAGASADTRVSRGWADRDLLIVVFAFIVLLVTVVITSSPGVNYGGADGKAAQAEILATLEFARPFYITNLNPIQGLGSQMMPMTCG
jgi:hypothetical protein